MSLILTLLVISPYTNEPSTADDTAMGWINHNPNRAQLLLNLTKQAFENVSSYHLVDVHTEVFDNKINVIYTYSKNNDEHSVIGYYYTIENTDTCPLFAISVFPSIFFCQKSANGYYIEIWTNGIMVSSVTSIPPDLDINSVGWAYWNELKWDNRVELFEWIGINRKNLKYIIK